MRAARRLGVLEVARCGTRPSSRVRARASLVQHLLRGGYKRGLHAFQGGPTHHNTLGYLGEKRGRGVATTGEPALATPLWDMPYVDDVGVVSQSPKQPRKMVGIIVVMCAALGLVVSEVKTEIMYLCTKGMPEATAIFSVEAAGQVYSQTNDFVYLGGSVNLSIEVDRRIGSAWRSFRKYTLELYDRPSAPLELKIRMLRAEVLGTVTHGYVT